MMEQILIKSSLFYKIYRLSFQEGAFCIWRLDVTCTDRNKPFTFYFAKRSSVYKFLSKYRPVHSYDFWYNVFYPTLSFCSAYKISASVFGNLSFVL